MSIPLIGNVGFTEISSAGSLTTAASTKIGLPIQLFKLTSSISGQLTLTENSNHKKVIIDTNGNNIINSSGSPLNVDCPSGVPVELKGSGNVQSTVKTFTSAVTDTSNTGTTTIAEAGNSTLAVTTNHTFTEQVRDDNRNSGSGASFGDGFTTVVSPVTGSNTSLLVNESYYSSSITTDFGGVGLDNINRSDFGMSFTHAFLEDGTPISGAIVGPSGPSTFDGVSAQQPTTNTTHSHAGSTYRFMGWNAALVGVNNGNSGTFAINIFINSSNGAAVVAIIGGRGAFNQIKNVDVFTTSTGRKFTFTNNTSHTITLSGSDPYSSTSVSASGTGVVNRDSTDGSFSITGTFPDTNDAGAPLSSLGLNETSSTTVNVDNHTGTNSVKAF
tara:strand:- start:832 stop:1989 length:1158 start_codon:yes stop_codon:yes gene_type:complete